MRQISKADLIEAMEAGGRFDGPKFKIHWENNPPSSPKPWIGSFQPPIQQASFESEVITKDSDILSAEGFEHQADLARTRATMDASLNSDIWPQVTRSTLHDALAEAAMRLNAQPQGHIDPSANLRMRTGLQLVGVEIVPDSAGDNSPLDLVNADFPFSLRLIGCVVRMPLALSNAKLVTLDLSGSALVGVDGSFLRSSGSVRLRRCYSNAPIDFRGAEIHGYFDACDALLNPFGLLPAGQSIDGDRGMLSLSQATIDNEVRLTRAIIVGGFAMKGLTTRRSIHLNEAILLSPLAALQMKLQSAQDSASIEHPRPVRSDIYLKNFNKLRNTAIALLFERLGSLSMDSLKQSFLNTLLNESLKVRTTALRADGVNIAGSLFANDALVMGRLRMKYGKVGGSISLQGCWLSSAEVQRDRFDQVEDINGNIRDICSYRTSTYANFATEAEVTNDELIYGADSYALDLRQCSIDGTVRIGEHSTAASQRETKIDGIVALEGAKINGNLAFDGTKFELTCRARKPLCNEPVSDYVTRRIDNDIKLIAEIKAGKQCSILAQGMTVGADLSFTGCKGLRGADFVNAAITGDLAFFEAMKPANCPEKLTITEASTDLSGRLKLAGARVGGDCKLIFDRVNGPYIKAERIVVGGALMICGKVNAEANIDNSQGTYEKMLEEARIDRKGLRKVAASSSANWSCKQTGMRQDQPMIDLGNAKASFFHHPPAAWPNAGRLLITGFRYQRAFNYGPLGPHPNPVKSCKPQGRRQWCSLIVTLGLFLGALVSLFASPYLLNQLGLPQIILLTCLLFFAFLLRLAGQAIPPYLNSNRPMAIDWLNLQTVSRNAYKMPGRGHIYHSLEPYAVAAQALREEGRWISANIVEERRQVVRERQLSWRIGFAQKLLFRTMAIINRYGFSLSRPLFLIGITIILGAMLANDANNRGAIQKKDYRVEGIVASNIILNQSEKMPSSGRYSDQIEFTPLVYAADKILPVVDLGQDGDWELKKLNYPFKMTPHLTYEYIFVILQLIGLSIVGLLLIALSTRVGLVFNRYNE